MPSVTVVIPCYNQEHFLHECLESVRQQTFSNWEAIVVDDASTNRDLKKLLQTFSDPRISVVRHPANKGLAASRNTGFQLAKTEWVLPLDSDDLLDKRFLAVTLGAMNEDPRVDAVFTNFQLFGASSEVWLRSVKSPRETLRKLWISGAGALMRKSLWVKTGGYPEIDALRFGNEDWDFWISAIKQDAKIIHIPLALYKYRVHQQSMSRRILPYYDYKTREVIYRRHKNYFNQFHAGPQFRADGFTNSAAESIRVGEYWRAVVLATRALVLGPFNRWAAILLLQAILRPRCFSVMSAFRKKLYVKRPIS